MRMKEYIDDLMQKRRHSSVLAMELHLFCINSLRPGDAYMHR